MEDTLKNRLQRMRTKRRIDDNTSRSPTRMTNDIDRHSELTDFAYMGSLFNRVEKKERSQLHEAARNGSTDLIHSLVAGGADVNEIGKHGKTPLHEAAWFCSYDAVRELLDKGADVNATDEFGDTPLHAALRPSLELEKTVLILIERGADINATAALGKTLLHEAARCGFEKVVLVMIEKGANINATDKYGNTPLHEAARHGFEKVVLVLIEQGADINATDTSGNTPLHEAARHGCEKVVSDLIEQGADVDATNQYGETPLHRAIEQGFHDVAVRLCDQGANVQMANIWGKTPLHIAAENERESVRLLIDRNSIVNAVDKDGRTPLHLAVGAKSSLAVRELVLCGANITLRDKHGTTPVHHASSFTWEKPDIVAALSDNRPGAALLFLWKPPEAFELSTNGDEALETLTNAITLIRQGSRVVATTFGAFVENEFGVWGLHFLSCITSAFTADNRTYENDEVVVVAQPTYIQIRSSMFRDKTKDLLKWLCLSFRKPQDGFISVSEGELFDNIFILRSLRPLVVYLSNNSSCWHGLFQSAVVGIDPATSTTQSISDCWLDVSFNFMVQISAVEYPLTIERGIILMGYSTALVPVRMIDDTHVLWHLEVAKHDSQISISELAAIQSYWLQVDNLDQLRAKRALVGWCPEATILLGTNKLSPNVTWSNGKVKKTSWHWSGANLQFLAQSAAPAQIGAQLGLSMSRTTNMLTFSPSNNYLKCLNNSATEHVVLYDLAAERAWLVPLLSTFHHMLAIYWNTIPPESRCAALPLATPSADGALASLNILREKGEFVVEESANEKSTIRDLIMGFSANFSRISVHSPFRTEVYGYELMDIVIDSPMADLRKKKIKKEGLGWAPLLSQVRCLFCSGIGNAIIGKKAIDLNSPCNEMPNGSNLMAATIPSINALSRRFGSGFQGPLCQLSTLHMWQLVGNPFTHCQHKGSSHETCWHTMQFLQEIQSIQKTNHRTEGPQRSTLSKDGAVVFGQQRRGISDSKPISVLTYRF